MNRLAMTSSTADIVHEMLLDPDDHERGLFCLLRAGQGHRGQRLVVGDVLPLPEGAVAARSADHFVPSAQWVSSVLGQAVEERAGLLFIHSHPNADYPPGLSTLDLESFSTLAGACADMLDGPLAAAVVHPTGWGGVLWNNGELEHIEHVWALGRTLHPLHPPRTVTDDIGLDSRQRDALGDANDVLRALTVGLVGASGNGSPIAEQLVRMGVARATLVEPDMLDSPSNARRVLGATMADLNASTAPPKVDVVGRHLDGLGFDVAVSRVNGDVRVEETFRNLLDCDIVICATDTHGSRAVLNSLPSAYLLPVIDVGIRVAGRAGALAGLWSEIRVLTAGSACLWCGGVLDADRIRIENLPEEERQLLRQEGYLPGSVGEPTPSVIPLNFTAAGMTGSALLGLISADAEWAPATYRFDAMMGDAFTGGATADPTCRCNHDHALADQAPPSFIA